MATRRGMVKSTRKNKETNKNNEEDREQTRDNREQTIDDRQQWHGRAVVQVNGTYFLWFANGFVPSFFFCSFVVVLRVVGQPVRGREGRKREWQETEQTKK
jgi:hypothetical protein